MKKRVRRFGGTEPEENFWPSFTDMISTIALILFFLMILAYIGNLVLSQNWNVTQSQLEDANVQISKREDKLRLLEDEVDKTTAELEKGQVALRLSEDEIDRQKDIIAASNQELGTLRSNLQGIAVLRINILEKVKESIEEELGSKNDSGEDLVAIADNGNIVINESFFFEPGSSSVKEDGKELLGELASAFEKVLDDGSIRNNIDAINIQGHTDAVKGVINNRDLGANRSSNVVKYMMRKNPDLESKYASYFMSSSFSEFRPIENNEDVKDRSKNRRIEISIILKDSEIQDLINKYLEDSMSIFEQ